MEPDPLLESLRNAVAAMPDDVPLRLHLAALLLRGGQRRRSGPADRAGRGAGRGL